MAFYVFQVAPRYEERLLKFAERRGGGLREQLVWPRRRLRVRKQGKWLVSEAPIFSGYVFFRAETLAKEDYWQIRQLPGFVHFLPSNANIQPLNANDTQLLSHFLSFGEIVGSSTVYFDEQKRIRVTAGPLKGLEGRIVKVDKRKGRARVRLDLYDESFLIDFGFQALEAAPAPATAAPAG